MTTINSIVGKSVNPIKDRLVVLSNHIRAEHMSDKDILMERGWYRENMDEIQTDIAHVVKNVREVQKAKLQFQTIKRQTRERFTFTVLGIKVNGEDGRLSIAFAEDDSDFVLVVTIL